MPIDAEHLLHFPIPDVRQSLTKPDSAFYALSVGAGQDPMDPAELDFVDARRALVAVPSMIVVLGYPGFWLADPATGVDALRLVHGEQGFRLTRTLPVEGEVIGRTRVTGLVDKGPGKGALLYTEKTLIEAATGSVIGTTTSTTFLRGDGGFGGPSGPVKPPHEVPQSTPDFVIDLPTRPEQALLYRLNGDDNPLHADPDFAARAGFPRPILHGLCTFGVVCRALIRALCPRNPERLIGIDCRFSAPVFPGETIRTEIWPGDAFRARVVERDVVVINNGRAFFMDDAA